MVGGAHPTSAFDGHPRELVEVEREELAVVLLDQEPVEPELVVLGVGVPRPGPLLLVLQHGPADLAGQSVVPGGDLLGHPHAGPGAEAVSEGIVHVGWEYTEATGGGRDGGLARPGPDFSLLATSPKGRASSGAARARGTVRRPDWNHEGTKARRKIRKRLDVSPPSLCSLLSAPLRALVPSWSYRNDKRRQSRESHRS